MVEAQSYYDRAIKDVDCGRRLIAPDDVTRRYSLDIYRASAQIGLGFVAVRQARLNDAEGFYRESKGNPRSPRSQSFTLSIYQKLEAELQEARRPVGRARIEDPREPLCRALKLFNVISPDP